jgi:choice-of-anchor A domain-containing protein
MNRSWNFRTLLFPIALGLGALSNAADLGVANRFNAFVFENAATAGGHSDGAIAVGGNFNMGYEANQHDLGATVGASTNVGLYVGGNVVAGSPVARVQRGDAFVGGSVTGTLHMQTGAFFNAANLAVFSTQLAYSTAQSVAIRSAAKQIISIGDPNNINLDVSTNNLNGNRRTYSVDASQLSSLSTFNIQNATSSDTIIIDVTGTTVNWGWQVNATYKNKILWNFKDALTINVGARNFDGAMLAPLAHLNQTNNLQGNVIVKSWSNTGAPELHFGNQFKFDGDAYEPVPEPASVIAIAAGLLGVHRRRRSQK